MNRLIALEGCLVLFLALALASCGGGSGSNGSNNNSTGTNTTPGQAQGVYEGTTSTGLTFDAIVLPSDTFYAIYGSVSGNVLFVCGMATGQGTSNNGKYTATENDFDYCGGSLLTVSGNVSASYTPGSTLSGSLTEGANSETFSGTVPSASLFNYTTAASLSAISGSWSGTLTDGETATVNIDSLGNASGSSSAGCLFSGTIVPDSTNKNFFDVSLTFGSSPCALPNQKATGIVVDYLLSDGVTRQFLAAVNSGSSAGIVFAAQR